MARVVYDLTRTQRNNLRKLADYLEKLPEDYQHFNMAAYIENEELELDPHNFANYAKNNGGVGQHGCGTVACAVGHGPAAGILFRDEWDEPKKVWDEDKEEYAFVVDPNWDQYSRRFVPIRSPEWNWCFSGGWDEVDNHHWGAAARIRYLLAGRPLPDGFTYYAEPGRWDGVVDLYAEFRKQPEALTTA